MQYYLLKDVYGNDLLDTEGVKLVDGDIIIFVPGDDKNRDYQTYLEWKAEGNTAQTEA